MHVIADVAAAAGAGGGFDAGAVAKGGDQVGGVGDMADVGKVQVHVATLTRAVPASRTIGERRRTKVNALRECAHSLCRVSRAGTLASRGGTWQGGGAMTSPSPSPSAGGALIALGALGGVTIGFLIGEATPGFLIGLALGVVASVGIWWRGSRR